MSGFSPGARTGVTTSGLLLPGSAATAKRPRETTTAASRQRWASVMSRLLSAGVRQLSQTPATRESSRVKSKGFRHPDARDVDTAHAGDGVFAPPAGNRDV